MTDTDIINGVVALLSLEEQNEATPQVEKLSPHEQSDAFLKKCHEDYDTYRIYNLKIQTKKT